MSSERPQDRAAPSPPPEGHKETSGGPPLPEPDFELLPRRSGGRGWRGAQAIAWAALAASLVWLGYAGLQYRRAQAEAAARLERTQWARSQVQAQPSVPSAAYLEQAAKAAALLQAPIGDWLRELENCQPDNARTRELYVDAQERKVSTQVEVVGNVDIQDWLHCLNSGAESRPWRLLQMTLQPVGGASGAAAEAWRVTLVRHGG